MASIKAFFSNIKEALLVILSIISAIFIGLFVFEKKKTEVQGALKDNAETNGKIEAINSQITSVEDQTKEKENEPVTKDDLLGFLNDPNKSK